MERKMQNSSTLTAKIQFWHLMVLVSTVTSKKANFFFQNSVFYNIISEVKMFEFFRQKQTQDFSKTGKFLEIFDAKIREF